MRNKFLLLVAAGMLSAGMASAQAVVSSGNANAKPAVQPGSYATRGVPVNLQIDQTLRTDSRVDNESYVNQLGADNFGRVDQSGDNHVANMVQVNTSGSLFGNDAYQRQTNGAGTVGRNDANALQIGKDNYVDQAQAGNANLAIAEQRTATGAAVQRNYSVQEQTGSNNYGQVTQESSGNFAHQSQTSSITSSIGGGLVPGSIDNGNYARTLQGGGTGVGATADNQWSQIVQNGQNNRALVSQDH